MNLKTLQLILTIKLPNDILTKIIEDNFKYDLCIICKKTIPIYNKKCKKCYWMSEKLEL